MTSSSLLGNGTPVVRGASGKGVRTKSARRRALLRQENARAQHRRSTVGGWRAAAAGEPTQ